MTARITLHCDTKRQSGTCISQLITDARTVGATRAVADAQGWSTSTDGRDDYCPNCSGNNNAQPGTTVIYLYPSSEQPDGGEQP
jgi:hypothetical protein